MIITITIDSNDLAAIFGAPKSVPSPVKPASVKEDAPPAPTPINAATANGKEPFSRRGILNLLQKRGPLPYRDMKSYFGAKNANSLRALLATMKGAAVKDEHGRWALSA